MKNIELKNTIIEMKNIIIFILLSLSISCDKQQDIIIDDDVHHVEIKNKEKIYDVMLIDKTSLWVLSNCDSIVKTEQEIKIKEDNFIFK